MDESDSFTPSRERRAGFVVRSWICAEGHCAPNPEFFPADTYVGRIADVNYIEGAIEMRLGDRVLLDTSCWDLIDQLWRYFLDGLQHVLLNRPFRTYLPDQPLEVRFTPEGSNVRVYTAFGGEVIVPRRLFLSVMLDAAQEFYAALARWLPSAECISIVREPLDLIEDIARQMPPR